MLLEQQLMDLGLTRGEARVFLSLLKLGSSKVGAVVKDSRVSYSKVYDVLERLASKGLVSHATVGNVRRFNAVEPYRLHDYLQKREDALRAQKATAASLVGELALVANRNRTPGAEIFVGDKGLHTAYEILLRDASKSDVLRYFYPFDDYHPVATPFYSRLYLFQKGKKMAAQRGIGTVAFSRSAHYGEITGKVDMRFVAFPLPGTMDIFKDKLLMVSWEGKTGILVTSKEIADHFARYFDSVWRIAIATTTTTTIAGTHRRSRR